LGDGYLNDQKIKAFAQANAFFLDEFSKKPGNIK